MSDEPRPAAKPYVAPKDRVPPPMDHEPGFKDTAFTWEMGDLILDRIGHGETVKEITDDPRMPSYATVYRWTHVVPEFGEAWRRVRACFAAGWAYVAEEEARRKPIRRSGRRSTFKACVAMQLIWRIEMGASLSEVVRRPDMPSFRAFYRWMRRFPWFRAQYMEACYWREFMARAQATDAAIDGLRGDPRLGRARMEAIEGRIGRIRPRRFVNWV
jgi:hypothetical protein